MRAPSVWTMGSPTLRLSGHRRQYSDWLYFDERLGGDLALSPRNQGKSVGPEHRRQDMRDLRAGRVGAAVVVDAHADHLVARRVTGQVAGQHRPAVALWRSPLQRGERRAVEQQ